MPHSEQYIARRQNKMTSTTPPMRTRNIQDTPIQMAGIFTTEASAHATLNPLLHVPGMTPQQVRVLGPQDANKRTRELFGRRTEQFEKVAQDVMMRAHLMSGGIIGAVLGAILYFWLTRRGMPSLLFSPIPWAHLQRCSAARPSSALFWAASSLRSHRAPTCVQR